MKEPSRGWTPPDPSRSQPGRLGRTPRGEGTRARSQPDAPPWKPPPADPGHPWPGATLRPGLPGPEAPPASRAEYSLGAPGSRTPAEGRLGFRARSRWYPFIPTVLVVMLIVAIAELLLPSGHPAVNAAGKNVSVTTHGAQTTALAKSNPAAGKPPAKAKAKPAHVKPKAKPKTNSKAKAKPRNKSASPANHHVNRTAHGKSVRLPGKSPSPSPPPPPPPSPSPSPSPPPAPPVTPQGFTMAVGGVTRNYIVYAQPNISGRVPALVVLQGANAATSVEIGRDNLIPFANAGQLVLVYAQPVRESWNAGACCESAQAQGVNDVGFIDQLVTTIQGRSDVSSVYLAGYSNGGKLAYDVVCSNPGLVKAFAVIAATPTVGCPDGAPVSLVTMDGTDDPNQAYNSSSTQHTNGSFKEASTVDEVNTWVKRDGCTSHSQQKMGSMVLDSWSHCNGGTAVQLGSIVGGGHEWYGGVGSTPSDTDLIWAFLTQTVPAAQSGSPTATSSPAS